MFARTTVRQAFPLLVLVALVVLAIAVQAGVRQGTFVQHWLDPAPTATPANVDGSPLSAGADDGSANKNAAPSELGSQPPTGRGGNPTAADSGGPADAGPDVVGSDQVPLVSCGPKPCRH